MGGRQKKRTRSMKNHVATLCLIASGLILVPAITSAGEPRPPEKAAMLDADRGDFEKDVAEASAKMKEALRRMPRNKFFGDLYKTIAAGDIKTAEKLLAEQVRKHPEYKKDENYRAAKSKIAYSKGDFNTAYSEADKFVREIETAFAPKKPWEMDYQDKHIRDSVQYAYILRYQASAGMPHYEDALADLDHALKLETTPELLRAKTGVLLALGKYAEAAIAADSAYGMNNSVFEHSPYRDHYCWLFSEHAYTVKYCGYFAAMAKERASVGQKSK